MLFLNIFFLFLFVVLDTSKDFSESKSYFLFSSSSSSFLLLPPKKERRIVFNEDIEENSKHF